MPTIDPLLCLLNLFAEIVKMRSVLPSSFLCIFTERSKAPFG
jgi:hypothetical protein